MSGVFLRLFKYRPGDGRVSQEDFFTEALAGVLDASLSLRVDFVRRLIGAEGIEAAHVSTQQGLAGDGRVDMWIEARGVGKTRHLLAIENKIGASVGRDQLRAYDRALRATGHAGSRTLACVTRHERPSFTSAPTVTFRPVYWNEVARWFREWFRSHSKEPVAPLVRELLLLMEEWEMDVHLTADDLAAATRHRTSVERQVLQILDEVYAECKIPQGQGNWVFNRQLLCYTSRRFSKAMKAWAEFGFDFERDDAGWSVPRLGLPSAYFAVGGAEGQILKKRLATLGWSAPPEEWGDSYLRAKQLERMVVSGESLHLQYLEFFKTARAELWEALKL